MTGKLYLVSTPIGNLGDITYRAAKTLAEADFVAAEDTRVSVKILNHLEIKKPLVSYYEHNRAESGAKIVERLLAGESCALVTDAGTPAISDPGEDLVRLCAERGIDVVPVPGACAAISALAVSALPTQRFCFEGFLAVSGKSRREHLDSLKDERRTMVFYEAPHKLKRTLDDMLAVFGDRRIALCRELTKLHEEVMRCTLSEAAALYSETPPKGEFVLVIEGKTAADAPDIDAAVETVLRLQESGLLLREAAKQAAKLTGCGKNELYELALKKK